MAVGLQRKPLEILLVEDNPGDVRLTFEALRDGTVSNHLSVVPDGIEALAFVRREGRYANAVRPDLILLDLNLPKKDGHEVLAQIKRDPRSKEIPVVILTASKGEEDILRSYELHATCYLTKPVDREHFIKIVKSVGDVLGHRCGTPAR